MLALTVVVGAVLRIRQYLFMRSFWFDELFLASNVRDLSLIGLTRQLRFRQAAPVGFLWSAKASVAAFGQSELAYRLIPLAAGILTVVCVALVARRVFRLSAAIAAAGMIALAGESIRYSSEFKQYTTEAAVAAALLLVATYCLGRTLADEPRRPVVLAVVGGLALTSSVSAIFLLAGIAVVLVIQTVRSRRYERYLAAACVALTWAATATVMYLASWSRNAQNKSLHNYWAAYFGPAPWAHPSWYLSAWSEMINTQVAISWSWAAFGLTVGGFVWLARRSSPLATIAVIAVLSTMVGSWAGVYPFNGRLLLFLVPVVCVLFGAVVDAVGALFGRLHATHGRLAAGACALVLVSGSIPTAAATYRHPYQSEEMRQALTALRPQFRPADRLFVSDSAALGFEFYRDRTGFGDVRTVPAKPSPDRLPGFLRQIDALGRGRVWLLFSRVHADNAYANEARYIARHVHGKILRTIRREGVVAIEIEQST